MLVSATENNDETPSGMLLHGIMSTIAEFYSRNLATETVKGLSQKAVRGGTIGKAPLGYRNVGVRDVNGREVRTPPTPRRPSGFPVSAVPSAVAPIASASRRMLAAAPKAMRRQPGDGARVLCA